MKKIKSVCLAAVLLMAAGCASSNTSQSQTSSLPQAPITDTVTAEPEPVIKATQTTANDKGWEISVAGVRSLGQTYQGEYDTYEAAKAWTLVTVTLKNTTGERQREDASPFRFFHTKLIDSDGNTYDLKEQEIKYSFDLINKPFFPAEARTWNFLFDTPKGIKGEQLVIYKSITEKPVRLKL